MTALVTEIMNNPIWSYHIAKGIVILCCFPIHEYAHARIALKLGDHTGKQAGRVTLNPFKHLDLWGTILTIVFGIGFAKPVPVNSGNFRKPKRDLALVSLAGPLSNLLMAAGFLILEQNFCHHAGEYVSLTVMHFVSGLLRYASFINLGLAVFNMIPVPPLDGYHVLLAVLPERVYNMAVRLERHTALALLVLFITFNLFGVSPVNDSAMRLFTGLDKLCSLVFKT